jgi:histidinol-phosphate aminotransferase
MYFREHILGMKPYHPPLAGRYGSGSDLLDFNERLLPVHRAVQKAMEEWVCSGASWCYPEYEGLTEALAHYAQAPKENLFFGNGSDQLLDCLFRAVVAPGDKVLLPSPSFAMYRQCADLVQAEMDTYSLLSEDPLQALSQKLDGGDVRMAVLCQPNNPTGTFLEVSKIKDLIKRHKDVWFIVDEAYFEFSGESLQIPHEAPPDNLVITRTFSKAFGLASLRLGYMMASKEMIEQCGKIRGPYDINRLAVVAALASFEYLDDVQSYSEDVMKVQKLRVEEALQGMGLEFMDSRANFLLIRRPPKDLAQHLMDSGIRVRLMSQPELQGDFRLSIAHCEPTERLLGALETYSKAH